nr:uncharacterized protein LOC110380962 isoform X1 [Helicoverpa armigera]
MTRCSVPLCREKANHSFPKDAELRRRWLEAIKRVDFVPKGARVCRKHFHDSDYMRPVGFPGIYAGNKKEFDNAGIYTGRAPLHRFLKKNAVPSIFEWNSSSLSRLNLARLKRRKGRRHRKYRERISSDSQKRDSMDADDSHDKCSNSTRSHAQSHHCHGCSKYLVRAQCTQTSNSLRLFSAKDLVTDDESVYFYTGLDTYAQFTLLLSTLVPMACDIKYRSSDLCNLSIEDQFLILLIKLRRSKPDFEIGKMFGVNKCDVCNVFITWVNFVCDNWRRISFWPSHHLASTHLPSVFRGSCPTGIVDSKTSEIPITMESQHNAVKVSFSQYRFKDKLKFLVGCSAEGLSIYCTQLEPPVPLTPGEGKEEGLLKSVNHEAAKTVPVDKLIDMTKTYKILACALNQTYNPLSVKIFCICVMLCRFKEGFVGKNNA